MKNIRRHSESKKIAHLKAQQESGLSVVNYCQIHQISKQSIYTWRKKYKNIIRQSESSHDFIPLTVRLPKSEEVDPNPVIAQVKHPNGCLISFYKGCSPLFLSQTINRL